MNPTCYAPSVPTRFDPASNSRISSIDLRAALQWGEVSVLVPDYNPAADVQMAIDHMTVALEEFRPDDYIIAVGDPILIAAAVYYAAQACGDDPVRVLRWSRIANNYQLSEVYL